MEDEGEAVPGLDDLGEAATLLLLQHRLRLQDGESTVMTLTTHTKQTDLGKNDR